MIIIIMAYFLPEFSSRASRISTKQSTIDWQTDNTACTAVRSSFFNILKLEVTAILIFRDCVT